MNNRVVGFGVVLLVVSLPLVLYNTSSIAPNPNFPGYTELKTTYPYSIAGAAVALAGIVLLVLGVVLKAPPKKENLAET